MPFRRSPKLSYGPTFKEVGVIANATRRAKFRGNSTCPEYHRAMRKPNYGKQRGTSSSISSLSKRLAKLPLHSAPPTAKRPRPQINKPVTSREAPKK